MNVQLSELKNFSDIGDSDEILISHYEGSRKVSYAMTFGDLYNYIRKKLMEDTSSITVPGKWTFTQDINGTA
jgi:hypothetical protein